MNRFKRKRLNNKYIKQELKDSDYLLSNINGYSLDLEQRIAIITDECANLIVAGAGSGKSLTMIGKIRYLIERKGIKENEILCITFTNEAAKNLENNIKKNYNYDINVYTFHKLSLEILKNKKYNIVDEINLEYIVNEYFFIIDDYKKKIIKIILNKIDYPYKYILKCKDLTNLKKLIITFINLLKTNDCKIEEFVKLKKYQYVIYIILDIYRLYNLELKSTNTMDFNDMIKFATINAKEIKMPKYKYIIVDEYQDTSYIRYLLLKKIINITNAKIICVGDDYQSIYRFTGCDLDVFLNFKRYFKNAKILKINNTYRNSQELINLAGCFIMKNKKQLYKKLVSSKRIKKPVKITYTKSLKEILNIILKKYKEILILGRNNNDINNYFNVDKDGYFIYGASKIRYLTVHASKGLEAECVILLNVIDDKLGFPNQIKDNPLLKYVNRSKNYFPFEEERRLFYVALTRTKNEIYILSKYSKQSIFLKELIKSNKKYIEIV